MNIKQVSVSATVDDATCFATWAATEDAIEWVTLDALERMGASYGH